MSKKRRASSTAGSSGSVALLYGVEDFPMMDIVEAPEVKQHFMCSCNKIK